MQKASHPRAVTSLVEKIHRGVKMEKSLRGRGLSSSPHRLLVGFDFDIQLPLIPISGELSN